MPHNFILHHTGIKEAALSYFFVVCVWFSHGAENLLLQICVTIAIIEAYGQRKGGVLIVHRTHMNSEEPLKITIAPLPCKIDEALQHQLHAFVPMLQLLSKWHSVRVLQYFATHPLRSIQ